MFIRYRSVGPDGAVHQRSGITGKLLDICPRIQSSIMSTLRDTNLPVASLETGLHQTPTFHIKP